MLIGRKTTINKQTNIFNFETKIDSILMPSSWLFAFSFISPTLPINLIKLAIRYWNEGFYFLFHAKCVFSSIHTRLLFTPTAGTGWIFYLENRHLRVAVCVCVDVVCTWNITRCCSITQWSMCVCGGGAIWRCICVCECTHNFTEAQRVNPC